MERICIECGEKYKHIKKYSLHQWQIRKFCSSKCSGISKQKKDGMSRGERWRRKKGMLKKYTPEWLDKIKSTTKDAMLKPEINWKLHKKRIPMSLITRKKHSDIMAGKLPLNMISSSAYPNIQRGDYENSKGTMYFRSKWEANYALYLDFLIKQNQIKDWEYEKDVFIFHKISFGTRSYRPDFKIKNNNGSIEYHEVKGYMDGRSKTKLRRMSKYYPEIKIILIDQSFYRDLQKKVGKMLNFY